MSVFKLLVGQHLRYYSADGAGGSPCPEPSFNTMPKAPFYSINVSDGVVIASVLLFERANRTWRATSGTCPHEETLPIPAVQTPIPCSDRFLQAWPDIFFIPAKLTYALSAEGWVFGLTLVSITVIV